MGSLLFFEDSIVESITGLGIVHLLGIGEDGLLHRLQMGFDFGMQLLGAYHDAVGIVDGGLGQTDLVGLLEVFEVFGIHARQLHLLVEASSEALLETVVID